MARHTELGKRGEALAAAFLQARGYRIIHRNYRFRKAEIDIIARKDEVLVIVEVKARTSEAFEPIAGTVSRKKVRLLVMAADHYVQGMQWDAEVRFDIVTVYFHKGGPEIRHIENAFYHF